MCLCLFLLLNRLSLSSVTAKQDPVTAGQYNFNNQTEDQVGNSTPILNSDLTTTHLTTGTQADPFDIPNNATGAGCLIDTQMGLIAVASAGGLVLCLMISTLVLACQVCYLQRQVRTPRTSRSNVDLVSGTGYWGTDLPEVGGLVGPCDASVMLEEVRADREMEKEANVEEVKGEKAGAGLEDGANKMEFDLEEMPAQMVSSTSRDSCLDVPRDLEDMPLVV